MRAHIYTITIGKKKKTAKLLLLLSLRGEDDRRTGGCVKGNVTIGRSCNRFDAGTVVGAMWSSSVSQGTRQTNVGGGVDVRDHARTTRPAPHARFSRAYASSSPAAPMATSRPTSAPNRPLSNPKQLKMLSPVSHREYAVKPLITVDNLNTAPYSLRRKAKSEKGETERLGVNAGAGGWAGYSTVGREGFRRKRHRIGEEGLTGSKGIV